MYDKSRILNLLNSRIEKLRLNYTLTPDMLDILILDVTRVLDNNLTEIINQLKDDMGVKINSQEKKTFRRFLLGYPAKTNCLNCKLEKFNASPEDIQKAYSLIEDGFKRNEKMMILSLVARIRKQLLDEGQNIPEQYIRYLHDLQNNHHQLIIITQSSPNPNFANNLAEIVEKNYSLLSNYHHLIIICDNPDSISDWKSLAEISIYLENFKTEKNFNLFNKKNKEDRIEEFKNFLKNHSQISYRPHLDELIESFYEGVSYGFHFKDLFVTDNGQKQILVMQKIELDEEPKKCPACFEEQVRGNSYSKLLYRSFECTNPSCPARSKIGRGKRYDLFAAKRQILLEKNNNNNKIENNVYIHMRRDIITDSNQLLEELISLYSWSGDSVLLINTEFTQRIFKGRIITNESYKNFDNHSRIGELKIGKLFKAISESIVFNEHDAKCNDIFELNNSTIINGNSSFIIPFIDKKIKAPKISGAITSPPYYNAREYSQWQNFLLYLVDMMINAKSIIKSMQPNAYYIYNIGDIVGQDNVYIKSNMSSRRLMLGFYSIFIFDYAGYKTLSNLIWDKGEVESKRNSTSNLFSGYVNPVNSYEHCFVFSNNDALEILPTKIIKINSVKKINSKGENTLGHTAPFPEEIPELLLQFINEAALVVDPYLGSGTTCIALQRKNIRCIGFEINKDYYELACNRINNIFSGQISFKDLNIDY